MDEKIRVILAEDQNIYIETLTKWLEQSENVALISVVKTQLGAVRETLKHHPDVLILDLFFRKDKETTLMAIKQIREGAPLTGIMILTNFPDHIDSSFKRGKDLIVVDKDFLYTQEDLINHIQAAYELPKLVEPQIDNHQKLTSRQNEVLDLLCQGLSNKEIAEKLFISETTVKKHLADIYGIFDVSSRTQAIAFATGKGSHS